VLCISTGEGSRGGQKNFWGVPAILPDINLNASCSAHLLVNVLGKNMHKLFLRLALVTAAFLPAASAIAADLDVEIVPPPPPPPVEELRPATYDWTGVSAGVFIASNASKGKFNASPLCGCSTADYTLNGLGYGAGFRFGADYQMGDIVLGAVGDWALGGEIASNKVGTVSTYLKAKNMGTFRGRAGWAFDDTLIYGTAGMALAEMEFGGSSGTAADSESKWTKGVVLGAGMEHALSDDVSIGVEYLFTKFGKTDHFLTDGTVANTGTAHMKYNDFHTVRASVNYRFSL
jgi:outer membrane immunogenic protein